MKLNNTIIIILTIITGYLLIPHLSSMSGLLLVILMLIGYGITKDYIISIFIATIITYVLVLLNTKKEKNNSIIEKFKGKKKKANVKAKSKKDKKKNIETFEDDDIPIFDSKNSFLSNFKSLTPSQIKGLNEDTKQLIKTQQTLLETLKTMGPAIKDGKNVLDTFKNYFGSDSDIGNVLN